MTHYFLSLLFAPAIIKPILLVCAVALFKHLASQKGRNASFYCLIPVVAIAVSIIFTHGLTLAVMASYISLAGFLLFNSRLRQCPDCKEKVILEAVKCKHCGSSISPA